MFLTKDCSFFNEFLSELSILLEWLKWEVESREESCELAKNTMAETSYLKNFRDRIII
jgi:hypothetical protein